MSLFFKSASDPQYYVCKICNVKIKQRTDGSACNMNKHTKRKHPGTKSSPDASYNQYAESNSTASKIHKLEDELQCILACRLSVEQKIILYQQCAIKFFSPPVNDGGIDEQDSESGSGIESGNVVGSESDSVEWE